MPSRREKSRRPAAQAALLGAVAGLTGCLAMNLVSYCWARAKSPPVHRPLVQHGTRPDVASAQADTSRTSIDTATAKFAKRIAQPLLDRKLSREEQDQGGKVVHYGYGASVGAICGLSGGRLGLDDIRAGFLFGLFVWAGGVLIGLPVLKLAADARAYTLGEHSFGVAGHLAYGLVLSRTYRVLDQLLQCDD